MASKLKSANKLLRVIKVVIVKIANKQIAEALSFRRKLTAIKL